MRPGKNQLKSWWRLQRGRGFCEGGSQHWSRRGLTWITKIIARGISHVKHFSDCISEGFHCRVDSVLGLRFVPYAERESPHTRAELACDVNKMVFPAWVLLLPGFVPDSASRSREEHAIEQEEANETKSALTRPPGVWSPTRTKLGCRSPGGSLRATLERG
jgi:hypothetical protein